MIFQSHGEFLLARAFVLMAWLTYHLENKLLLFNAFCTLLVYYSLPGTMRSEDGAGSNWSGLIREL